uniref:Thioredoxin domain-containing protein n=1 Tax=Grammatophora oceanica TaxID=210454 RepID=A0A7S1Y331_9STRA|mmetsp:Transcript_14505/g.21337  ORF Transcript_14505/g.21337 Transcript_14505/m.21337 type:complete len:297 (+) Transcript_14505:121-1011(+)
MILTATWKDGVSGRRKMSLFLLVLLLVGERPFSSAFLVNPQGRKTSLSSSLCLLNLMKVKVQPVQFDGDNSSSASRQASRRSAAVVAPSPSSTSSPSPVSENNRVIVPQYNPVIDITSLPELLRFIDEAPPNQLCVIKFWASYCKVCQRAKQIFRRLAVVDDETCHIDDVSCDRSFAAVEIVQTGTSVVKQLGVTKTPFIQIYRNGKCVASFSTGPAHNFRRKVDDTLKLVKTRTLEEWDKFEEDFAAEIDVNQQELRKLRIQAEQEADHASQQDRASPTDEQAEPHDDGDGTLTP